MTSQEKRGLTNMQGLVHCETRRTSQGQAACSSCPMQVSYVNIHPSWLIFETSVKFVPSFPAISSHASIASSPGCCSLDSKNSVVKLEACTIAQSGV